MPSAPARRDAMPRTRPVAESMGDAMKKKAEQEMKNQKKHATITEENDEDDQYSDGFDWEIMWFNYYKFNI